jgi:4'-phosphopantetheinyl transferase
MLILKKTIENLTWGIWKIDEDIDSLFSMLDNTSELIALKEKIQSESRLKEKVAVRVLLKNLTGSEKTIHYQDNGKPYFSDRLTHISISHTKNYAAVVLSETQDIGIDIEYISDRVKRIQSKFIGETEYIDPENEIIHLLLHWSAKESIYKVLDREGIDLKKDLIIDKFTPDTNGLFYAHEKYTKANMRFTVQYFTTQEYVLTLAFPHV